MTGILINDDSDEYAVQADAGKHHLTSDDADVENAAPDASTMVPVGGVVSSVMESLTRKVFPAASLTHATVNLLPSPVVSA